MSSTSTAASPISGARNLETDYLLTGSYGQEAAAKFIALGILSAGLDAYVPFEIQDAARTAILGSAVRTVEPSAVSAELQPSNIVLLGADRHKQAVKMIVDTNKENHAGRLMELMLSRQFGLGEAFEKAPRLGGPTRTVAEHRDGVCGGSPRIAQSRECRQMNMAVSEQISRLRAMMLIREFEEQLAKRKDHGFQLLSSGEEGVAVGLSAALTSEDQLLTGGRSIGPALARGVDPDRLMAELLGRSTGTNRGKGGRGHLADPKSGFFGAHAVVGGNISIAAGVALSMQMDRKEGIVAILFGDGASAAGGAARDAEHRDDLETAAAVRLQQQPAVRFDTAFGGAGPQAAFRFRARVRHSFPDDRRHGRQRRRRRDAGGCGADPRRRRAGIHRVRLVSLRQSLNDGARDAQPR